MTRLVGDSLTVGGAVRRADDEVNHLLGERALGAASERIRHRRPKTPSVPVHETRHETRRGAVRRLRVSPPPAEGAVSRGAARTPRASVPVSREIRVANVRARRRRVSIEAVKRRARDADARGIDTLRGVEGEKTSGTSGKSCRGATTRSNRRKSHRGAGRRRRRRRRRIGASSRRTRGPRRDRWRRRACVRVARRGGVPSRRRRAGGGPRRATSRRGVRSGRRRPTPRAARRATRRGARVSTPRGARGTTAGRGARAAALHHSHRARAATQTLAPRRAESRRERERRLAHQVDVAGARPGAPNPSARTRPRH